MTPPQEVGGDGEEIAYDQTTRSETFYEITLPKIRNQTWEGGGFPLMLARELGSNVTPNSVLTTN